MKDIEIVYIKWYYRRYQYIEETILNILKYI